MRYWILALLSLCLCAHTSGASSQYAAQQGRIIDLADQIIIQGGSIAYDSLLQLSSLQEQEALKRGNTYDAALLALIKVNIYGHLGDIGFAISKTQRMFDQLEPGDSTCEMALALMAKGVTLMHTSQHTSAAQTMDQAQGIFQLRDDTSIMPRVLVLQLYNDFLSKDTARMSDHLVQLSRATSALPQQDRALFSYYNTIFTAFRDICQGRFEQARDTIDMLQKSPKKAATLRHGVLYVNYLYYLHTNKYPQAKQAIELLLTSATTDGTQPTIDIRRTLMEYARLLELMEEHHKACEIYYKISMQTDSLFAGSYKRQVDRLNLIYRASKTEVESISEHNKSLLLYIILSGMVVVVVTTGMAFIRRRNRLLLQSERRLANLKADAADSIRSKSLFLSNMSHDLRTPLGAIVGFSHMLADMEEIDQETNQMCAEHISQNSELLMKLFNDINDLSALNEGVLTFTMEPCDTLALCRNVINSVALVNKNQAELEFVCNLDSLQITTDKERLQQMLINLLVNATKFTKQGFIRLSLDTQGGVARFIVEDSGCGIPPERQAKIFRRFEKLHEGVQGVGLGLSICQLIVTHLGGSIWIDPSYTRGARFVFTHPIKEGNNSAI